MTGERVLDLNVILFLTFLMLLFALVGLLKEKIEWAVFPGLGIVLGLFFHTAFLADGDITQVSGGSTVVIASASTSVTSVWQALQFVPLMLTLMCFFIATYRVGKTLSD